MKQFFWQMFLEAETYVTGTEWVITVYFMVVYTSKTLDETLTRLEVSVGYRLSRVLGVYSHYKTYLSISTFTLLGCWSLY